VQDCFFTYANNTTKKFDLVFADLPYFLFPDRAYDTLEYAGDSVFPTQTKQHVKGFKDDLEFLSYFAEALFKVANQDSFALIYHSTQQEAPLIAALKKTAKNQKRKFTFSHVYSAKSELNSTAMAFANTKGPINVVERALHLVIGDPTWANYGKDSETLEPIKHIPNLNISDPETSTHPFHKPPHDYALWMLFFSMPHHNVLEAFAGSCPSMHGSMKYGRNLTLVEKCENWRPLFLNNWSELKKHYCELRNKNNQKLYEFPLNVPTLALSPRKTLAGKSLPPYEPTKIDDDDSNDEDFIVRSDASEGGSESSFTEDEPKGKKVPKISLKLQKPVLPIKPRHTTEQDDMDAAVKASLLTLQSGEKSGEPSGELSTLKSTEVPGDNQTNNPDDIVPPSPPKTVTAPEPLPSTHPTSPGVLSTEKSTEVSGDNQTNNPEDIVPQSPPEHVTAPEPLPSTHPTSQILDNPPTPKPPKSPELITSKPATMDPPASQNISVKVPAQPLKSTRTKRGAAAIEETSKEPQKKKKVEKKVMTTDAALRGLTANVTRGRKK
jgi:hypothetical protein